MGVEVVEMVEEEVVVPLEVEVVDHPGEEVLEPWL